MNTLEKIIRLVMPFAAWGIHPDDRPDGNALMEAFLKRARAMESPRVLELGTKRSDPARSTMHREFVPNAGEYLGTDIEPGADVDIVADVHRLAQVVGEEQFDILISCSTFEHFKYPHLAAHQVMKTLRIGGLLFIQTHQTFPLHAYPYDYFRFSRQALAGLFGTQMGFRVLATDYEFPARLFSPRDHYLARMPAYLNVRLFGEKVIRTPEVYIYELDTE
jgi:hypothetical protein